MSKCRNQSPEDEHQEETHSGQQSRSGGNLARNVGTRSELNRLADPENREPVIGSDNPAYDARKGPKTIAKIQKDRNKS